MSGPITFAPNDSVSINVPELRMVSCLYGIRTKSENDIYSASSSNDALFSTKVVFGVDTDFISFTIPKNIGGRFSVFTPVGLLPISVAGLNVAKILDGARESFDKVDRAIEYAIIRDILYHKHKYIESFTVYNNKLYYFTEWLKQLFAETQGKDSKGILPISCVNTRDLHSLGQFFQDGSDIIFETVIGIDKDFKIALEQYDIELNNLNRIALDKVALAHSNGHTPSNIITIDEKNEHTIGELIYFFILSSIIGAILLDVNPFNQPGVQDYKDLINNELK